VRRIAVLVEPGGARAKANAALLASARSLAGDDACVVAFALASGGGALETARGAAETLVLRGPGLADPQPDDVTGALAEACEALRPDVLLLPHNTLGREVGPRLAARLRAPVVTDCTAAWGEPGTTTVIAERPCFSGKAVSNWAVDGDGLAILTMRPSGAAAGEPAPGDGFVRTLNLKRAVPSRTSLVERAVPPPGELRLEDADVVIGVGRGLGSREAFLSCVVEGLAPALGAACGGSRGAVDLGIVPAELQIGLTGRVISPKVYVAIGLSGSPQHMAGCGGAGTIVAINVDPQAPIFACAQYGVVGDYRRVVPAFADRLREITSVAT
jgi:electron transfer flavoprotein alpha subunit